MLLVSFSLRKLQYDASFFQKAQHSDSADEEEVVIIIDWPLPKHASGKGTSSDPVSVSSSQSTLILSDASTVAYLEGLPDLPSLNDSFCN